MRFCRPDIRQIWEALHESKAESTSDAGSTGWTPSAPSLSRSSPQIGFQKCLPAATIIQELRAEVEVTKLGMFSAILEQKRRQELAKLCPRTRTESLQKGPVNSLIQTHIPKLDFRETKRRIHQASGDKKIRRWAGTSKQQIS